MVKRVAELPIINNADTFLCARVGIDLKLLMLPGIEVTSMIWIEGTCRMLIQGPILNMAVIDTLPVSSKAGETFRLELRANNCGDHSSISDFDVVLLTMTGCMVEYKYISNPVITAPPPAAVIMRACITGKLTLMHPEAQR